MKAVAYLKSLENVEVYQVTLDSPNQCQYSFVISITNG